MYFEWMGMFLKLCKKNALSLYICFSFFVACSHIKPYGPKCWAIGCADVEINNEQRTRSLPRHTTIPLPAIVVRHFKRWWHEYKQRFTTLVHENRTTGVLFLYFYHPSWWLLLFVVVLLWILGWEGRGGVQGYDGDWMIMRGPYLRGINSNTWTMTTITHTPIYSI